MKSTSSRRARAIHRLKPVVDLMEWDMPLEPFNSMVKDGTAGPAIEKAIGAIQPEAVTSPQETVSVVERW